MWLEPILAFDIQQLLGADWLPQTRSVVALLYLTVFVLISAIVVLIQKKRAREIDISVPTCVSKGSKRDDIKMKTYNRVAVVSLGLVFLVSTVVSLLLIMAGDVETNPGPETAGAAADTTDYKFAYETLVDCGDKIVHGLSMDPKIMATSLHSKRFITLETLNDITLKPETNRDKAIRLHLAILGVVKEYPHKYSDFIQILEMNKRLHAKLLQVLSETYIKIKNGTKHRSKEVQPASVIKYADYLKQCYLKEPVLQDHPWPPHDPSIGQYYINVALIKHEKNIHTEPSSRGDLLRGKLDQIQAEKMSIEVSDIFSKTGETLSAFKILMDGAPGVGKTTLCRKICQDWARGDCGILQDYDLLVYISLRDSKPQKVEELFYHDDPDIQSAVVKHVRKTSGDGVVFIFDGYDELSKIEREKKSLLLDIFEGRILHKCSAVVSSRPYASDRRILRTSKLTHHIEVLGFKEKQIKECIKTAITDETHAEHLIKELFSRHDLLSLCYIPVNCSILIYVYKKEGFNIPTTLTELFQLFLKNTFERQKDIHLCEQETLDQYMTNLSKLAFESLTEDKLAFQKRDVPSQQEALLGLMTATKSFSSSGMAVTYQFIHLTIQEYLAAKWISQLKEQQQAKFLRDHLLDDRFRMVLIFLAGITRFEGDRLQEVLSIHELKIYLKDPLNLHEPTFFSDDLHEDYFKKLSHLLIHLVYESQNPKSCSKLANSIEGKVLKYRAVGYSLTSEFAVNTMGYFIAYSGCTWEVIDLHIEESFSTFFQQMQRASRSTSIKRFVVNFNDTKLSRVSLIQTLWALLQTPPFKSLEYIDASYPSEQAGIFNVVDDHEIPYNHQDLSQLCLKHVYLEFPQLSFSEPIIAEHIKSLLRNCRTLEYLELTSQNGFLNIDVDSLSGLLNEIQQSSVKHLSLGINIPNYHHYEKSVIFNSLEQLLLNRTDLQSLSLQTTENGYVSNFQFGMTPRTPRHNRILEVLTSSKLRKLRLSSCFVISHIPRQLANMLSMNNTLNSLILCIYHTEQAYASTILNDLSIGLRSNTTLKRLVVDYGATFGMPAILPLYQALKTQTSIEVLVIVPNLHSSTYNVNNIPLVLLHNSVLSVVTIKSRITKSQLKSIARCLVLNGRRRSIELEFGHSEDQESLNDNFIQTKVNEFKGYLLHAMIMFMSHFLSTRRQQQRMFLQTYVIKTTEFMYSWETYQNSYNDVDIESYFS